MSAFRFDRHPIVFLRPRISHPYAWVGHIPFAYLLVDLLRPRRLVELGTDSGNSYLAFCQAIEHLGTATQATAVDSWEGDPHARLYGEAVYATLSAYHDPRYGKFSHLMRGFFDDAVSKFKDGSIDLLHIDGLHTYEAVKHDFQTWSPKLSDRAVVIFHDSQVRERGFGVWKFIDELRGKHRCFDFKHSNGLAVVEVGAKVPSAFRDFMAHALADVATVQSYFESIAATIVDEQSGSPVQVGAERRNVECRVYYRNKNQQYDEQRSVTISSGIDSGPADLVFSLPKGVRPDFVRLDPADVPCVFGLRHLALGKAGSKQHVLIKNDPARIRAVSGELLPAQAPVWVRMMTFDSDPFVEIAIEDVWANFDKASPVTMEFGVEYESVLSDPKLIPLAHSGAQSLQEFRASGQQQWGYPAIQRQVQALQSQVQSLDHGSTNAVAAYQQRDGVLQGFVEALNQHVRLLAQHVDTLTRNQSDSAESLGGYVNQLAQHMDQLTKNQTGSVESLVERLGELSQRMDRVTEVQSGSAQSLGGYVNQLAQHMDQLTKNQSGSVESLVERMDELSRRMDRVTEAQSGSAESMGGYIGQLAQHMDQLTKNQTHSVESLVERMDELSRRTDRVTEAQSGSAESFRGHVGQLAQDLDQLTRNQALAIEMQRAADFRGQALLEDKAALAAALEDLRLGMRASEARQEEVRRFQLHLSGKIDDLANRGVVQRIKRLLGK
ncbi:MAG TPA: class I SAM-dependent methyltransferase [Pseudoxanthomonas sp.]